jgi:hypothetical protein
MKCDKLQVENMVERKQTLRATPVLVVAPPLSTPAFHHACAWQQRVGWGDPTPATRIRTAWRAEPAQKGKEKT